MHVILEKHTPYTTPPCLGTDLLSMSNAAGASAEAAGAGGAAEQAKEASSSRAWPHSGADRPDSASGQIPLPPCSFQICLCQWRCAHAARFAVRPDTIVMLFLLPWPQTHVLFKSAHFMRRVWCISSGLAPQAIHNVVLWAAPSQLPSWRHASGSKGYCPHRCLS